MAAPAAETTARGSGPAVDGANALARRLEVLSGNIQREAAGMRSSTTPGDSWVRMKAFSTVAP